MGQSTPDLNNGGLFIRGGWGDNVVGQVEENAIQDHLHKDNGHYHTVGSLLCIEYPARARSLRARRACALRALELLLADGNPTVGREKTF